MKITREKACQRLHHRVQTPLVVDINDDRYEAMDWSLGGLRVSDYETASTSIGQLLSCCFRLPFQGFEIAFETRIETVRLDPTTRQMAAKFIELSDRQKELMNHFIEQLVRGSMVPIGDTILRIDSPVTPVSTKPDASPAEELPASRWPIKLVAMSSLYVTVGCLCFYLVGTAIFNNFLSLEITHAVAEKQIEPIISLIDGQIADVSVVKDIPLIPGEPIFRINSPDLNERIKNAKVTLEQSKLELESLRKKHAVVIDIYDSHLTKEARFLEIEIDEKQQEVTLATESLVTLYEHKEELLVASPSHGRIVRLLRQQGSLVQKGDTLAYFEHDKEAVVTAFVTQTEATYLQLEEPAIVHSNYLNESWQAYVTAIEPIELITRKFVPDERVMRVELALHGDTHSLPSGTPVTVEFPATKVDDLLPNQKTKTELALAISDPI